MKKDILRENLKELEIEKISPLKAIRLFCIKCSGDSSYEVERCTAPNCSLYPFRFGYNPFSERGSNMTEEQRKAASERFKEYRKNNKKEI